MTDTPIKMVAFDLDDTLAPSKTAISSAMARALRDLLAVTEVCVISGGRFEQFASQVLAHLPRGTRLEALHLMPTCGTRYLRFDEGWRELYAHDLSADEKARAIAAVEQQARAAGLWEPDEVVTGERIEDRGSQITYSALGQQASVPDKKAWDPDGIKREVLRARVAAILTDLEVRAGGSTSIDITRQGIDKAYGIQELARVSGIGLDEMLFVGDRLTPGGNDYPVRALGVRCFEVAGPEDTLVFLAELTPRLSEEQA